MASGGVDRMVKPMILDQPSQSPGTVGLTLPVALTIAGSDSGGGAGIQADLKTFAFLNVHGTCALTCVTAQNTLGVTQVAAMDPSLVVAQIEAVITDLGVQSLKTGMLLTGDIMIAVGDTLSQYPKIPWVLDPVMVSRSGSKLMDDRAIGILQSQLLPRATLITPNRYEAEILSGIRVTDAASQEQAARIIHDRYPTAVVLVKGGGLQGSAQGVDWWWDGQRSQALRTETVDTPHTHGTGCTLSAAIAAFLAQGYGLWDATLQAKIYVTQALHHSLALGQGQGPVGHSFPILGRDWEGSD